MMGRRVKVIILLYVIFLAVLFLMCSTDLIIREPEKEVYQIAVIIEDARDDNYGNFRKGMDQAAMELHADVHFITLYEKMDADQQMELMGREQQDGADALIVMPADEQRVLGALAQKQMTIPVVLLGAGPTGEGVSGAVVADYKEMGKMVAEELVKDVPEDCPVLIFSDSQKRDAMSRLFAEGAEAVLEKYGRAFRNVIRKDQGQNFKDAIESLEAVGRQTVILAENPAILAETAAILAEDPKVSDDGLFFHGSVRGLYGRGSTLSILNYLDRGVVTGTGVIDEFSVGYLSVSTAVRVLEEKRIQEAVWMDSYYIEKEDLRDPACERLLFPIE